MDRYCRKTEERIKKNNVLKIMKIIVVVGRRKLRVFYGRVNGQGKLE